MSQVISFQEAKARREQAKLPAVATPTSDAKQQSLTAVKSLTLSGGKESTFIREARKFRFVRVENPPAFIVMNTKILPPAFPPDPPAPLVA